MSSIDHIATLFLSLALIDGPLVYTERELMYGCLQAWQSDLDRAGYLALLRRISGPVGRADSPAALAALAAESAAVLQPKIRKNRKRSVMLMHHLCQLGQVDGALNTAEQRFLQKILRALGLHRRISVDIRGGLASLSTVSRDEAA